jgi:hypothetical protein
MTIQATTLKRRKINQKKTKKPIHFLILKPIPIPIENRHLSKKPIPIPTDCQKSIPQNSITDPCGLTSAFQSSQSCIRPSLLFVFGL